MVESGVTRPWRQVWMILFFVFLFGAYHGNAQCAGEDGTIEICDYSNPSNQFLDLFSVLGGSPSPGGTWSFPLPTGALNTSTGLLDVWQLHLSGVYQFAYTVPGACADNVAVATVIIGPWAGVPAPNGSACSDDDSVNLFSFFEGVDPDPQQNGTWSDDSNTGALSGSFLDATQAGLGTFQFTYTVPSAGSCPPVSVTIFVTVHRKPEPGSAPEQGYCDTDDFSPYTDINLQDLLSGEDPFGIWNDVGGTGQIFGFFDSHINLQQVFQTYGPGEYSYSYTVYPANPVCIQETATIVFVIEPHIDFTGATLVVNSDICESEMADATYSATLTQGPFPVPDGTYAFTYTISGPSNATIEAEADFAGGVMTFPIPPANFPEAGDYTVTIVQIKDKESPGYCPNPISVSDVLSIFPLPEIDPATVSIPAICLGEDAVATLSGSQLADGVYDMKYTLSGANTLPETNLQLTLSGGSATLVIPSALLPNPGATLLSITYIRSVATNCETTSTFTRTIVVNTKPNTSALQVVIANSCEGDVVTALLSGLGSLSNLTVTYSLSGANTALDQQVVVSASGGNASFVVPATLLTTTGATTLSIIGLQNNTNTCGVATASASRTFTIQPLPDVPVTSDQVFCGTDTPTVAQLTPTGATFNWYIDDVSDVVLPADTPLTNGTYFVSVTDPTTGCTSARAQANVTVITVDTPVLLPGGSAFCGVDNPTLATLSDNVGATGEMVWYDAAIDGVLLPDTTPLQEGVTYYGYDSDPVTGCVSPDGIAVTVTLTDCDPDEYAFMVPDGFSPNGDGINDTFRIPEIEFLYPDFRLEIYNRYGNLLFKGAINKPEWDGRAQSGAVIDGVVPNGVYFYILYFNRDDKSPRQGRLYLNR